MEIVQIFSFKFLQFVGLVFLIWFTYFQNVNCYPVPTDSQLRWHEREIGVIIHFNMATLNGSQGCDVSTVPSISQFNPTKLNVSQWVDSMVDLGAKYAVYVAKHNCGFCTWDTKVQFPDYNFQYNYSILYSPVNTRNVVKEFVEACYHRGIQTGFYYSVVSNSYLNVENGQVRNGSLSPGQVKVSQTEYDQIVVAQLTELWEQYGPLSEIWFDGGYTEDLKDQLEKLLALQPNAVAFNGLGVSKNPVRWVGTESGQSPYPNWSTGSQCKYIFLILNFNYFKY